MAQQEQGAPDVLETGRFNNNEPPSGKEFGIAPDSFLLSSLPRASAGLPRASAGLPRASAGLPRASAGLLRASAGLPHASADLPRASAGLPRGPSALRAPSRLALCAIHPLTKPRAATGPGGDSRPHLLRKGFLVSAIVYVKRRAFFTYYAVDSLVYVKFGLYFTQKSGVLVSTFSRALISGSHT